MLLLLLPPCSQPAACAATHQGQQLAYNGVCILQLPNEEALKESRCDIVFLLLSDVVMTAVDRGQMHSSCTLTISSDTFCTRCHGGSHMCNSMFGLVARSKDTQSDALMQSEGQQNKQER